jgi:hypothetical protein
VQGYNKKENCRPLTLMNIDEKSSIKYWQTKFNSILKSLYTMIKSGSSQGYRDGSIHANH